MFIYSPGTLLHVSHEGSPDLGLKMVVMVELYDPNIVQQAQFFARRKDWQQKDAGR